MMVVAKQNLPENIKARKVEKFLCTTSVILFLLFIIPVTFSYTLNIFGLKTMYVVSNSMYPTFERGDLLIGSTNYNSLAQGDIIAFNSKWFNNKIVTHRVFEIVDENTDSEIIPSDDSKIYTKGDNNFEVDPSSISKSDVVAEIVVIFPNVGYYMNTPVIITIIVTFFIVSSLRVFNWEEFFRRKLEKKSDGNGFDDKV